MEDVYRRNCIGIFPVPSLQRLNFIRNVSDTFFDHLEFMGVDVSG